MLSVRVTTPRTWSITLPTSGLLPTRPQRAKAHKLLRLFGPKIQMGIRLGAKAQTGLPTSAAIMNHETAFLHRTENPSARVGVFSVAPRMIAARPAPRSCFEIFSPSLRSCVARRGKEQCKVTYPAPNRATQW